MKLDYNAERAKIKLIILVFAVLFIAADLLYLYSTSGDITFTDSTGKPLRGVIESSTAGITGAHEENVNFVSWSHSPHKRIYFNALDAKNLSVNLRISGSSHDAKVMLENYGLNQPGSVNTPVPGTPVKYVEVSAMGVSFAEAEISIQYTDAEVKGLDVNNLTIYRYDSAAQAWSRLDTRIDEANKLLSATVNSLSIFAVAGRGIPQAIEVHDAGKIPVISDIKSLDEAKNVKMEAKTSTLPEAYVSERGELEVDALATKNVAVKLKVNTASRGEVILDDFGKNNPVSVPLPGRAVKYVEIGAKNISFSSANITIRYTDEELNGGTEHDLTIYHWNGASWDAVPTTIDTVNKTLSATTASLSNWGVATPYRYFLTCNAGTSLNSVTGGAYSTNFTCGTNTAPMKIGLLNATSAGAGASTRIRLAAAATGQWNFARFINNSAYPTDVNVTGINGSISMYDRSAVGVGGWYEIGYYDPNGTANNFVGLFNSTVATTASSTQASYAISFNNQWGIIPAGNKSAVRVWMNSTTVSNAQPAFWSYGTTAIQDSSINVTIATPIGGAAPNITSWGNNKTNNQTFNFSINVSESVNFNATADQTITQWNWYRDDVNQSWNYNNFTTSWSTAGSYHIDLNATNANGTSGTITWYVTVNPAPNITSWGNNKTNNASLNLTLNASESVQFNATANQTITQWNWYKDDVFQTSNTTANTFNTSWSAAGSYHIDLNATNANGTSSTITWYVTVNAPPNITSWGNNKTNNASLNLTINTSEVIKFNATANQTITQWNWYKDDVNQNNNFDNFTTSWSAAGSYHIDLNGTNANGTSNSIRWNVTVTTPPGNPPNITSWGNNKTNNASLNLTINTSKVIKFNATANQTITQWNWYKDDVNQNNNFDNFTTSWSAAGSYHIDLNGTNANGTSNSIRWNVTITAVRAVNLSNISALSSTTTTGTNATYVLNLTNNGTDADSYTLNISTTTASTAALNITSPVFLNAGATTIFALNVTNTSSGIFYVNVTATSVNDSTKFMYINTTTTVNIAPTYIPPAPVNLASTQGNFWINYTWQAGAGNVTSSYNVSVNGTWTNGTASTYSNNSGLAPHGWSNISVYSYNSSGTGTLNTTAVSQNTQVLNNPVTIGNVLSSYTLTAGGTLSIYPTSSDLDGDTPTFARNFTNGTFYTNNGTLLWTTTSSDVGSHYWQINVSDGYGSVSSVNLTVTVSSAQTYIPPTPANLVSTQGNFWINYTWSAGSGNVTSSYNVSVNGTWTNGTASTYSNNSGLAPHGWSNISVYSYNSSGTGTLNATVVSQNTQVLNNPVTIGNVLSSYTLTAGGTLSIYPTSSDLDGDTPTFARNFTNGTFYTNNGTLLWTTTSSDVGSHYWQINVSDGYGSVSPVNFTVTVSSAQTYIPPTPANLASTQGNFWINYTWSAGSGNVTNSYNAGVNGVWNNGSSNTYNNNSGLAPHGWSNITLFAYNNSGSGALSLTPASNNTQVANNIPVQDPIGNKVVNMNSLLTFTVHANDTDLDPITYGTNATKGTLNPTTGVYSWTPGISDVGTYVWYFNSSDGYGGVASETITVTVNAIPLYSLSGYVSDKSSVLPLNGAAVQTNTSQTTTTNTTGFYNFSLSNGTYLITASKAGYITNSTTITINGANVTNANISLSSGFTAFKIKTPLRHSSNISNGSVWGSYWTNTTPLTACLYCHNDTKHNATPLGRTLSWAPNYVLYGSIGTNTSCTNCHYKGDSNYSQMNSTFVSAGRPIPPEITNGTNWNGTFSNYYNHSLSSYTDQDCKACHGSLLSGSANMSEFQHNVAIGVAGGPNCISCHDIGGTATGKLVNFTTMNDSSAIHKNLNSNATSGYPSADFRCWACHGNGSEPASGGHPSNYKTPYRCPDCHVPVAGQNLNFTPNNTLLNVSNHYWNGTNITTSNVTSCYSCHNRTEMMLLAYAPDNGTGAVYGGANGGNSSTSHYGKKRTDMTVMDNTTYCSYCHNTTTNNATFYVSDFNNTMANHTSRATTPLCTTCHYNGRIHNITLAKPVSNDTLCKTCHGTGGSALTNNKSEHRNLYCTECHANNTVGTLAVKDIHAIKYLLQNNTFSTSNSSAVNCVTCHQNTTVDSSLTGFTAIKIKTPMRHSDNTSNGSVWGSYWTSNNSITACIYCHNDTKHNATPLGRILSWAPNYVLYGSIGTNTSCTNCHYKGDSNYTQMNSTFVSTGLLIPPEITNGTNWKGNANYYNHSLINYTDATCKLCHGSRLNASANMSEFMHNVTNNMTGICTDCHYSFATMNTTTRPDRYVNSTLYSASPHGSVSCENCHTKGHRNIGARKACEDCHAVQQNPITDRDRHNITRMPSTYMYLGTSVVNITTCTTCHDPGLYSNATSKYGYYGYGKTYDCDYCHTYPDKTYS